MAGFPRGTVALREGQCPGKCDKPARGAPAPILRVEFELAAEVGKGTYRYLVG